MGNITTFIELIYPIILGLILIAIQFFFHSQPNQPAKFTLSIFGVINFERDIKNILLIRLLLAFGAISVLCIPSFRDYTVFFPTYYKMEVFFDNNGIKDALSGFSKKEIEELNIKNNWLNSKDDYLRYLNNELQTKFKIPFQFDLQKGDVYSIGETFFKVTKIKGWQKYKVDEAKGNLKHIIEKPKEKELSFESEFILLDTGTNYIDVSIIDIYFGYTKILKPEFKQIIKSSPTKSIYHHKVVAATKIRFFPVVDIGKTIYFIKEGSLNKLVPVAYAVYSPI